MIGITSAPSDKPFKRIEHGRERAAVRDALTRELDPPSPRAFGDPWDSEKDGKLWLNRADEALLRK
ncbi:MAG: hypothetical protein JOY99_08610 [Sphingomonadaceae bacterium]|nr:hypothetical protein [Sphingomonadaceae bacterium]